MSELTIRIPDPVSGKLRAYLAEHAEHGDDPAAFVAAVIEEKLDKLVSGNGASSASLMDLAGCMATGKPRPGDEAVDAAIADHIVRENPGPAA